MPASKQAAYGAVRRAWPTARTQVEGVPFCRGIVQEALLETLFGAGCGLDKRCLYRLTHRMDAMAEWATFGFLALRAWRTGLFRPSLEAVGQAAPLVRRTCNDAAKGETEGRQMPWASPGGEQDGALFFA